MYTILVNYDWNDDSNIGLTGETLELKSDSVEETDTEVEETELEVE